MTSPLRRSWARLHPYAQASYPLLALAAIFAAYIVINKIFGDCEWGNSNPACCEPLDITPYVNEAVGGGHKKASVQALSGRSMWVLVAGLNHIACLASVLVAFYLLRETFDRYANALLRALIFLCLFLGLSAVVGLFMAPKAGPHDAPLLNVLAETVQRDVKNIVPIVRGTIGVSYAAAALFMWTTCAIVWPPPPVRRRAAPKPGLISVTAEDRSGGVAAERQRTQARDIAERMRLLRVMLYFGTALLVIVSLRFSTELRWAADLLRAWNPASPGPAADAALKPIEGYFSVITTTAAATNTLIMAAVYVPAALVLRGRAHRLAAEVTGEGPTPAREKWLQERGLAFSLAEHLPRVAALLAPLLAGPIGELIGKAAK